MNLDIILRPVPDEILATLKRSDLLTLIRGEQQIRKHFQERVETLEALKKELEDQLMRIEGKFVTLKSKFFGPSSEKSPTDKSGKAKTSKIKKGGKAGTAKLPSERYPNLPIVEKELELQEIPDCRCCGIKMLASNMFETSEYVQVIPKQYLIIRQKRRKYRCGGCHGDIQTTPGLPRITPGSTYSDDMTIDIALSKYCDLIPVERYASMAARQGFTDLPANSLIEATHSLADFVSPAVEKVKEEILSLPVLMADETTHRMLEGDNKSRWFLWGFSGERSCYFECHDTRSGNVASTILKDSNCGILLSDVYSGYAKAVKDTNKIRLAMNLPPIKNAYCNAHARRYFKDSEEKFPEESKYFIEIYRKIYHLESLTKTSDPPESIALRAQMKPLFVEMKNKAQGFLDHISSKSILATAINYFVKNFEALTLFIEVPNLPIDNNAQERSLRNPVIGRKTWYGTHSKRGAGTAAKLFTLVESCKINKVNPREYFKALVAALHAHQNAFTPLTYLQRQRN